MRLVMVADVFPPLRSSGAVQLRDLSVELVRLGHELTVLIASPEVAHPCEVEHWRGVRVLRLRAPKTKDVSYMRRTIGEFLMPFFMIYNLRRSVFIDESFDAVIWYSPSIFLGPVVHWIKQQQQCQSYLIVRDIFPEWAVDMGLMRRGLPYCIFRLVARYQYAQADTIGVQSPGNRVYFPDQPGKARVEVLHNWLAESAISACPICVSETALAGRFVFIYAGNMGVAQGMDTLLGLAGSLQDRSDVGFLFVGRGSEAQRIREEASQRGLNNTLFFDEIDPDEIPGLYAQCHVGLVALDPRHRTHNIPGKFLTYMQAGLPVLASINPGNDLVDLITTEGVGRVCTTQDPEELKRQALALADDVRRGGVFFERCKLLSRKMFSTEAAARQVLDALAPKP